LSRRTTAEWLGHFAGLVPAAPVNDIRTALDNPFVHEAELIREYQRPGMLPLRMVAGPVVTADNPPCRAAPALGADTEAVLSDYGFSPADLQALRTDKVI